MATSLYYPQAASTSTACRRQMVCLRPQVILRVGGAGPCAGDACQMHASRKGNISPFRNNMVLSFYN